MIQMDKRVAKEKIASEKARAAYNFAHLNTKMSQLRAEQRRGQHAAISDQQMDELL